MTIYYPFQSIKINQQMIECASTWLQDEGYQTSAPHATHQVITRELVHTKLTTPVHERIGEPGLVEGWWVWGW